MSTVIHDPITLEIIQNHIFNWAIWPDFSEIAIRQEAVMQYQTIRIGEPLRLGRRKNAKYALRGMGGIRRGSECAP